MVPETLSHLTAVKGDVSDRLSDIGRISNGVKQEHQKSKKQGGMACLDKKKFFISSFTFEVFQGNSNLVSFTEVS